MRWQGGLTVACCLVASGTLVAGQAGSGVVGGGLLVQDRGDPRIVRPIPRNHQGRVLLGGASPDEKGVWLPGPGITAVPIKPIDQLPIQPWARAMFAHRQVNEFEPHTRCKPSGVARQFQTPYGVEFVELPEQQRIYIFDIGGPHTYRTIYMDGRTHPRNVVPMPYGHSIGWWEGDTLVVETTGFTEGFWMDRKGLPHTDRLRTVERFTRTEYDTIRYELTVDDPGAYTEVWTTAVVLRWEQNTELFEYICQQSNYAPTLMVGEFERVDRTSSIVP
ncbi:MAG TPA: hypothetical protein VNI78_03985 [Vicinamibacterales bacterium]|nr:hypothetical protein [Vicinamibacterales bacterium]